MREVLQRLEGVVRFKVKVAERTGSKMKDVLSNTNPWAGAHCGRVDCITCNQLNEEMPECTKRSLVYENICLQCNPDAAKKGPLLKHNMDIPSVYVGETARSVKERALEHWAAFRRWGQYEPHFKTLDSPSWV